MKYAHFPFKLRAKVRGAIKRMSINEIDNDKHEIECSKVNTKMKKCQLRVNKKRETQPENETEVRSNGKRSEGKAKPQR